VTAAERRALLGDEVIAEIEERVAQAPAPTPELLAQLRAVFAPVLATPRLMPDEPAAA
jgi:hypothetical protein